MRSDTHAYQPTDGAESPLGYRKAHGDRQGQAHSRFDPRFWQLRTWLVAAAVFCCLLIAIVVGAVEGVKANRYPDYSPLTYSLKDSYEGEGFWTDNFDYFTGYDPSSGFVHYSNPTQSAEMNLTFASATRAVLRVDNTETNASTGRHSARLTSKNQYTTGLFIFDVVNSPHGCATWPALWTSDPSNWPTNGEIDIMEAVNQATTGNQMTLHTTSSCTMKAKRHESGTALNTNCYNGTDSNAGCGVRGPVASFGATFNANGGGVYAMELRSAGIRVWFFPRSAIPDDITAATSPDPSGWGEALADFPSTECDIGSHFRNQSIIANIDVCGAWAGEESVFSGGGCGTDCQTYAAVNPAAFDDAWWEFSYFRVFEAVGA